MEKFKIKYLGHSAFLVETDKCYLMFDYAGTTSESGYMVVQSEIDFDNYKDKKLHMFQSHNHFDHYNRVIHKKALEYANVVTILGDIESDFKNTINMLPREIRKLDNITIYTGASTDLGVCFLIDLDGFVIFHGGDNADWGDDDPLNKVYYEEIDYLSNIGLNVNIAFIPICNFVGERPINMTKGALYAIEKMKPDLVVPMHGAGNEHLYEEFADDAKIAGYKNKIVCMKKIGSEY